MKSSKRREALVVALDEARDPMARRTFMKLMGASLGLAGLGACTRAPKGEIVPFARAPREQSPGRPRYYASATILDGYATGIVVESHEGRPTKIEGNSEHPASLGASGVFDQASVLGLYDPHRARAPKERGTVTTWDHVQRSITDGPWRNRRGHGLHFVLPPTSSPTIERLLDAISAAWPESAVHHVSAARRSNVWDGARLAFGRVLEPRYDLSNADVVVALDADFLASGPAHLRHARAFAERRRADSPERPMNRLYAIEAVPSVTGASADHRLAARARAVRDVAEALAFEILRARGEGTPTALIMSLLAKRTEERCLTDTEMRFVTAMARDLVRHHGRSAVLVGDAQDPIVHALAHVLDDALGNVGSTVTYGPSPIRDAGGRSHDPEALTAALDAGEVDTLVVLQENVAYASPGDRPLSSRIGRARTSVYLGLHENETAETCTFTLPEAHPLESWGDARAFDGTLTLVQPLIEPLYDGRTIADILALYTNEQPRDGAERTRDEIRRIAPRSEGKGDEAFVRRALQMGFIEQSAFSTVTPRLDEGAIIDALGAARAPSEGLELVLPTDSRVHDGRFANNAWLLELPTSLAKLTWTNAATFSAKTAASLGLETGDEVELHVDGRSVHAPALIAAGQADGTVGLTLGWGRSGAEELARGLGANAFVLQSAHAPYARTGLRVTKTGKRVDMPVTQHHRALEGRDESILRHATLEEHRANPTALSKRPKRPLPLYDTKPSAEHQWGMAIDLSICTGCSACVIACQAENNVPTVGKDGVLKGRAMHWLRIDVYETPERSGDRTLVQPMLCQHCEKAPCEYVCPVNATVHSDDGLNEMVYNRCVGTRFCSNNCPYKVRRFNWFDFHHGESETEALVHNPDVTVRERGVMEKCTFCVQRIREEEIRRDVGLPDPRTGSARRRAPLQTACQEACASRAIVFGDVADPTSEVSRMHGSVRAFAALDELGTDPRVRYLAKLTNENPELR